jgi:D-amino peptidase
LGEFDLLAFVAGEQKIPTLLISGDSKTIEQAGTNLPSTHMIITKFPLGNQGALCIHPKQVCELLKDEMRRAVKNAAGIEPPQIPPPIQLRIKVGDVERVDRIAWIPGLKRVDDQMFEFAGESMRQIAGLVYGLSILV